MVRKQIQRHDFLNGGPERQYSLNFNVEDQDPIGVVGGFSTTQVNPQFSMVNNNGDDIFVVNENEIVWRGQTLVTEERVREIVEEEIRLLGLT